MQNRKTKILATLGPSSESPEMMRKLIKEGVDAFRTNLAHGTYQDHARRVKFLRGNNAGKNIAIAADISGSKVRVGQLPEGGINLKVGDGVILDTSAKIWRKGILPIPFSVRLKNSGVKRGDQIIFDEGLMVLGVQSFSGEKISCRVIRGGILYSRRGVSIPGAMIHPAGISSRDREDILFGKRLGVDYISLSFLQKPADIAKARSLLKGSHTKIIAKIETQEALDNFDKILPQVDVVMIARGDLGLETSLAELPIRQKEIMVKCRQAGVPVIVATQMLASMVSNIVPTRAEVSDVANAVFDSADCLMLSAETAIGKHPLESVRMMREIIEASEKQAPADLFRNVAEHLPVNVAIAESACEAGRDVGAKFIIVGTTSGFSAKAVAKYRPSVPIAAVTQHQHVAEHLSLVWGIRTLYLPEKRSIESSLDSALAHLRKEKLIKRGDIIVYVSGIKFGIIGSTNMMRVVEI